MPLLLSAVGAVMRRPRALSSRVADSEEACWLDRRCYDALVSLLLFAVGAATVTLW